MSITLNTVKHFVELHAELAYFFVVLGVILEGEIVVIIAGIFAHLGSLNLYAALVATIVGGGLKSIFGYSLGYYLQKHHSGKPLVHQTQRRIAYFLPKFSKKPFWSIFLSRFLILGLHWFSLIFSGYRKVKIKLFAKAELASLLSWSISVLALGYFFSYTALSISRDIRKFIGIILLCFIAFFILEKIIAFVIELIESVDKKEKEDVDF